MQRANVIIFIMFFYAVFTIINKKVEISEILYSKYQINNKKRQFMFSIATIAALVVVTIIAMSLDLSDTVQQLLIGVITGFYFAMNSGLSRRIVADK